LGLAGVEWAWDALEECNLDTLLDGEWVNLEQCDRIGLDMDTLDDLTAATLEDGAKDTLEECNLDTLLDGEWANLEQCDRIDMDMMDTTDNLDSLEDLARVILEWDTLRACLDVDIKEIMDTLLDGVEWALDDQEWVTLDALGDLVWATVDLEGIILEDQEWVTPATLLDGMEWDTLRA